MKDSPRNRQLTEQMALGCKQIKESSPAGEFSFLSKIFGQQRERRFTNDQGDGNLWGCDCVGVAKDSGRNQRLKC